VYPAIPLSPQDIAYPCKRIPERQQSGSIVIHHFLIPASFILLRLLSLNHRKAYIEVSTFVLCRFPKHGHIQSDAGYHE